MNRDGDTINLYYGAADCSIALARGSVRSLLDWLEANGSCDRRREQELGDALRGAVQDLLQRFRAALGFRKRAREQERRRDGRHQIFGEECP